MATDTRKLGKGHEGLNDICKLAPLAQTYHLVDKTQEMAQKTTRSTEAKIISHVYRSARLLLCLPEDSNGHRRTTESFTRAENLSQGDIEKRTGLLRRYLSRVENGHTVPGVDTLEKLARALEVPMYRLFTDDEHVKKPNIPAEAIRSRAANSKQDRVLRAFAKLLARMNEKERGLLFHLAAKMASEPSKHIVLV